MFELILVIVIILVVRALYLFYVKLDKYISGSGKSDGTENDMETLHAYHDRKLRQATYESERAERSIKRDPSRGL